MMATPNSNKGDLPTAVPGTRPVRGRPRSEDSHEAVLGAVLDLLDKEGYGAVTIEGVARQAGVGKQTIYRWWKSKAELVLEAYANHSASKLPMPDKGHAISAVRLAKKNRKDGNLSKSDYNKIRRKAHKILNK